MFKTQSLPDEIVKTTDEPIIIDEIAPTSHGGSPYAKRHAKQNNNLTTTTSNRNSDTNSCDGWTSKDIGEIDSDSHNMSSDAKSVLTIYDYDYSPSQGSPYTRRYPAPQRITQKVNQNRPNNIDDIISISNNSLNNGLASRDEIHEESRFPIQVQRFQSMQSLRHLRDPHYQGIRSRKARRVIDKSGDRNVTNTNIPERSWRFLKDFVNTLIDEQWRYVITVFALSFFVCWIGFAALWYLIAHAHGDLNFDPKTGERLNDGPVPCVEGAFNFAGFLLFSIETQVTIGYGEKYPNEDCPEAVFLMVAQIVSGIAIEGAMVGIVYAKMIRPPKHSSTMQFSKKAAVCQRDSKLCLVFRVCDSRQNQAINSRVKAYWYEEKISMEGEKLKQFHQSLKLENNGRLFLIFPLTVCHVIDSQSPLYDLSAKDLLEKKFEIVVTLTGNSSLTGQMMQARSSYLPREIMWGNRFVNMIYYEKTQEVYRSDFDKFDELEVIDTPLCSARRLEEVQSELIDYFQDEINSPHYYYENLDKIGHRIPKTNDTSPKPDSSGMHQYTNSIDSITDQNRLKEMAEELEFKLQRHSIEMANAEANNNKASDSTFV